MFSFPDIRNAIFRAGRCLGSLIKRRRKSTCGESEKDELGKYLKCRKDVQLSICLVEDGTVHPCCDPPRVIIIGAGLAGLSAANRLLQCGIDNFIILEALDRPGGRIHSVHLANVIAELGAMSIYGGSIRNPVFVLASREGLIPDPTNEFPLGRGICMTSKGVVVPKLVGDTVPLSMALIIRQALNIYGKDTGDVGSLWDFIIARIHQECSLYPERYRKYAARYMLAISNDIRFRMASDLCKISASQFGSYVPPPGVDIRIPTGMIGILAPLLRSIPTCDHILYCKVVKKIIWSDKLSEKSDRVQVFTSDGKVYHGDYVILTMSLGVLKESLGWFQPGLPSVKTDAIRKMGFANCNNIFLEYTNPFWVWKSGTLRLGWSLKELMARTTCPDWTKGVGTVDEVPGSQQALMMGVSDVEADIVEGLSDVKVAEDATRTLRMFTGDSTIPYPANIVKSAWRKSPYFRGARAFIPIGATVVDQCALAAPVPDGKQCMPALFFAGDATTMGMTGTMHGARMSGVREADRILELTRLANGRPKPSLAEAMGWTKKPEQQKMAAKNK
ncbi:peroxisomal N(1)-acetyl-spermine/spermidine oxidase [Halyomorpha halys]|uniref:peroxisomal N(1)-acetyl-spermine/spermidine oxidase n=1 Tax=Halyomorpha halys TaxID=286706 RepID=UPI0006D51973|nr:peroxisomal N(1)-acetyl-spermine/spermidine oxidase-like [Halyomorpha halys]